MEIPFPLVPCAQVIPHGIMVIWQARGLLTLVAHQLSSSQTLGATGIRDDNYCDTCSTGSSTGALHVSLQVRRPRGEVHQEGQCTSLHAESPPALLPASSVSQAFGGTLRSLRARSCRWVRKQDGTEGSWKDDMSVKCTQGRPGTHGTSLQRVHRKDNVVRHIHLHFLTKKKEEEKVAKADIISNSQRHLVFPSLLLQLTLPPCHVSHLEPFGGLRAQKSMI